MGIKAGFESPEDKSWHDKRKFLKESFRPLGFSEEIINSALARFEPFDKNYCCRKIEIPEVDEIILRQINAQVHELTSQMLFDIARLCLEIEL
jgi:hypothetical protein